jgi:uncharacterized membrane protein YoaK (UPF0700 family)
MEMVREEVRSRPPVSSVSAQAIARAEPTEQARASASGSTSIARGVPTLLAFVAGYVDSCTFLAFNGLFVAQLTGSFVVAGSEFVTSNDGFLVKVLAIPAFFAAGVLTTVIVRAFGAGDRRALVTTLALEASLLVGLVWVGVSAASTAATSVAVLFGLSAMGVQSAMARLLLGEYGSTNVMTTNTTQLSIDLTEVVLARSQYRRSSPDAAGAGSYASARSRMTKLAPIMLGFLTGTIAGGLAYASTGLICLVLAISSVAALAIWAALDHFFGRAHLRLTDGAGGFDIHDAAELHVDEIVVGIGEERRPAHRACPLRSWIGW